MEDGIFPVQKTDEEWASELTPEQFRILRQHGTERPGASPLNGEKRSGTFQCAGCGQPLFDAETKYESCSGWPSFFAPLDGAVATTEDRSHFMVRTEVHCSRCGGHLGHVFPDGPRPSGLRFCMNGVALRFTPPDQIDNRQSTIDNPQTTIDQRPTTNDQRPTTNPTDD